MCSKYAKHSRLNSEHDWRDIYDHLMSLRMFTLTLNKIFIWAPNIMRQMAMGMIWICESSCRNCMLHILWEVDAENSIHVTACLADLYLLLNQRIRVRDLCVWLLAWPVQVASRMVSAFSKWRRFDKERQALSKVKATPQLWKLRSTYIICIDNELLDIVSYWG